MFHGINISRKLMRRATTAIIANRILESERASELTNAELSGVKWVLNRRIRNISDGSPFSTGQNEMIERLAIKLGVSCAVEESEAMVFCENNF